ncbi:MAG: hypothetical protein KGH94_05295, partial [Candidatus Micrarchaeota archaeon]|nr:hypothetical protein [Candidatus Micrarchaeota archaeon]
DKIFSGSYINEWQTKGDAWFFDNGFFSIRVVMSVKGYELLNQVRTKKSIDDLNASISDFDTKSQESFGELKNSIENFNKSSEALGKQTADYTAFVLVLTLIIAIASMVQIWNFAKTGVISYGIFGATGLLAIIILILLAIIVIFLRRWIKDYKQKSAVKEMLLKPESK